MLLATETWYVPVLRLTPTDNVCLYKIFDYFYNNHWKIIFPVRVTFYILIGLT